MQSEIRGDIATDTTEIQKGSWETAVYNYIDNSDTLEEGHKFLRRWNLPRISLEERENQDRLIVHEDIQEVTFFFFF